MSSESIWVGMRLRPLVERERGQAHCLKIEARPKLVGVGAYSIQIQTRLILYISYYYYFIIFPCIANQVYITYICIYIHMHT